MPYTFDPKEGHAKAFSQNMRISYKSAAVLCNVLRRKKLTVAKRLLNDLIEERREIGGKYYTKASRNILQLVEACEKNADFLGLDKGRLFVYMSAHMGSRMRRRRRKSAFGSLMKTTNMEVFLIEKGKKDMQKAGKKKGAEKAVEKHQAAEKVTEKKQTTEEKIEENENKESGQL